MPAPTRLASRLAPPLALLLAACGGSGSGGTTPPPNPPAQGTLQLVGKVMEDSGGGGTSPLAGAEVRVSVDRNGNGAVDAGEALTATSGADGSYTLSIQVTAGEPAVVRFSRSGFAPAVRTLQAAPSASVPVSATLRALDTLTPQGGSLADPGGTVSLSGLPAGTTGSARVFNPVTETDAFPGDFSDSLGNRLVSGVFGSFELRDAGGARLEALGAPATMRMRVPRDTWPVVADVTPGNQQIDVPLYSFREATGQWVREGAGWLEDASGARIPPSELAAIRAGSFAGALYAVGEVTHFSTWNVDWPVSSHGCVRGRVVNAAGTAPVPGATVTVSGVSYTGASQPVTVGADGTFCVEVMRSEAAGEDVDGNGVTGETSTVKIRVVSGGKVYDFGARSLSTANATCGGAGCLDAGDLALAGARELTAALCTVTGKVYRRDRATPVAGATVMAWDDTVPPEVLDALCFAGGQFLCSFVGTSGADGSYSFTTAGMGGLTLFAMSTAELEPGVIETAFGQRLAGDCPQGPLDLFLDSGYTAVTAAVSFAGGALSWTPASYGAALIWAEGQGGIKWMVQAPEGTPMPGPVTYGTVPPGAVQVTPASGAPAALSSGDTLHVLMSGTAADGFPYFGGGVTAVP